MTRHYLFRIPADLNPRSRPHNTNRQDIWAALIFRLNRLILRHQEKFGTSDRKRFWAKLVNGPHPSDNEMLASEGATFPLSMPGVSPRVRLRIAVYLENLFG